MNTFLTKIFKLLLSPDYRFFFMANKGLYKHLSDEQYITRMFKARLGYDINLSNPITFNEKLQWLKLYGFKTSYTDLVDKYKVKDIVSRIIGPEYVVPCYGFWSNINEIDFDSLPEQFVLKCNHNSGIGRCICSNKNQLNIDSVKKNLSRGLKQDYFLWCRETPYRGITRGVLAEKYLNDNTGNELRDYKFLCFGGKPVYMYCTNKGNDIYENFYDMDFNPINISHGYRRINPEIEKPKSFELMKILAEKLAKDMPFVRIDFFDVNNHVYFAEYTFYDWAGFKPLLNGWDKKLGDLIDLSLIKKI